MTRPDLPDTSLGGLQITAQALVSDDDLEVVRDSWTWDVGGHHRLRGNLGPTGVVVV
jgi:hypothetical protein